MPRRLLELQETVQRFTDDLAALAHQLARDALDRAIRERFDARAPHAGVARRTRTSSAQRAAEGARVIAHLLAHPGASSQQLRQHLAMRNEQMRAVITYLRGRRLVRSSGRTRASRYYATGRATTRRRRRAT